PNLRILSYELYTNSFELPTAEPIADVVPEQYDLSLNLEVESMAKDTTLPVDITFDLVIGGTTYPMTFSEPNEYNLLRKKAKQTYEVTCRPEDRDGYPVGDRCASLYRQQQTGKTYSLLMNKDAYDALKTRTTDTACSLVVTMDPALTIEEYNDNLADNTVTLPVMFLAPEAPSSKSKMIDQPGSSEVNLFNLRGGNSYGNSDFGIDYTIGPKMDYRKVTLDGYEAPYAVKFDGTGVVNANVFGLSVTPLNAGPEFDFDFSTGGLEQSYFKCGLYVFGYSIWAVEATMPDDFVAKGSVSLWNTQDDDGNEKYVKRAEKKKSKTFIVGVVPITVEGGVVGEIGLRGDLSFETGNKLTLAAGPFVSLTGMVEGGVGVPGFSVGAGVELLLIDLSLAFSPSLMLKPEVPIGIFELKVPIILTTLDGRAYLFARAFFWEYDYTIIEWEGYTYEINLFPLFYKGFGATDLYNVSYYTTTQFGGPSIAGGREGLLSHDWGTGGPAELNGQVDNFSAVFEGYFEFSGTDNYIWGDTGSSYGSDYTFYVIGDDHLTIKMDDKAIRSQAFYGETHFVETIPAGFHKLTVNYVEWENLAKLQLYWTSANQFATFYYNNTDFSGDPVLFETTNTIDMSWGDQSPKPGVVNSDYFSVRYQGDFTFPESTDYLFNAYGDDLVRIYVDGELILSGDYSAPVNATKYLTEGIHNVKVEHVETYGGAGLRVSWAPKNTFVGAYYNERTCKSRAIKVRNDGDYLKADPGLWEHHFLADFGYDRPSSEVNYDNFAAKWEGAFYFDGGDYDFVMTRDDEISVWVDDKLIGSYGTSKRADLVTSPITPGWHIVRIQYVEYTGNAVASVKWGKKQKDIVTEFYGTDFDEFDNLIPRAINRRSDMEQDWGNDAPTTDEWALDSNNFTIIWEGDFDFEAAPYLFEVGGDDNAQLYVDHVPIVKTTWKDWKAFTTESLAMNQGTHHIKAVIKEGGGSALGQVRWGQMTPNTLYGLKYDSAYTQSSASFQTFALDFDYNFGNGPALGVTDNFMIEWVGVFTLTEDGSYYFDGVADDKIELLVDNVVLQTYITPGWNYTTFIDNVLFRELTLLKLKKGTHSIKIRYWEYTGNSMVSFQMHKR
ncbi:MAG: hypothetical protein KKD44_06490, partial [Proteobacteria bacterium]|nr:hypothetical protein [Pseudomonadota bacterium]